MPRTETFALVRSVKPHACAMNLPNSANDSWDQNMLLAKEAMRNATPEEWEDRMRQFREWDVTLMDGLAGY